MANILVSGLINTETTVRVRQFPVNYYPIDYPFFGVNTAVSGGTLKSCLDEGVRRFGASRLALDLERMRLDFTLPHTMNVRRPLTAEELRRLRDISRASFARRESERTGSNPD